MASSRAARLRAAVHPKPHLKDEGIGVMATNLMGVLEEKQAEASPNALYQRSWVRAISLVRPAWQAEEGSPYRVSGTLADGGGALALALYLIAAAEDIAPEAVTRAQVEALLVREPGSALHLAATPAMGEIHLREYALPAATVAEWEMRLRNLGHDIDSDASGDPVVMHWRDLRQENGPAEDAPDGVWDDATLRVGPGLVDGLQAVFAPIYAGDLDF